MARRAKLEKAGKDEGSDPLFPQLTDQEDAQAAFDAAPLDGDEAALGVPVEDHSRSSQDQQQRPVAGDLNAEPRPETLTPAMARFVELKAANPDCLLFYRMGDFYELFFEDAVQASQALGITLTKRGRHNGEDIPMCGVPVHAADDYLQRLIKRGFRVAVCEQMEDPADARKRGTKAVVRRDVVRLVTPGTLTEDSLLDARAHNYLTAIFSAKPRTHKGDAAGEPAVCQFALASLDISTGEFIVGETTSTDLLGEIVRLSPKEMIVADTVSGSSQIQQAATVAGSALTPVPSPHFDALAGERELKARLGVAELGGFGSFSRSELAAIGALLKYIDLTQIGRRPVLRAPTRSGPKSIMMIDAASRMSLELVRSTSGERNGSLLAAIDRTVTAAGARELAARLASPLLDPVGIAERLDAVGFLISEHTVRDGVRKALAMAPDVARALARLGFNRGGPRELAMVRDGLNSASVCASTLRAGAGVMGLPAALAQTADHLATDDLDLATTLARALVDEPPMLRRDGGFVRSGYSRDLDDYRALRDESRQVIARLQLKYQELAANKGLKIKHNNVLGYFIEVTALQAKALQCAPLDQTFHHRQTLASAMRFSTQELADIEGRILEAGEKALSIEQDVFNTLADMIAANAGRLTRLAGALAELDHACGLAHVAEEQNYVRPVLDESRAFAVTGGRHPVVEQALRRAHAVSFIDNDCVLSVAPPPPAGFGEGSPRRDDARIWLVTGPNMAGKSTFLRQNALIAVLAQIGSYVPARAAHIGIVDRLFSRVGAADDLARGRSTFMVEMVETAGILNQATDRSFVILDEVGRGTSTFDGLSIAWAMVEYLHDKNRCRALFATHYHELTALADKLGAVANVTIDVKEWHDEIIFLHKVVPGAADRSYGIHVAKLAGLPRAVLARANEVLAALEAKERRHMPGTPLDDLPLFSSAHFAKAEHGAPPRASALEVRDTPVQPPPRASALLDAVTAINPDELTPRRALDELYRLKALAAAGRSD